MTIPTSTGSRFTVGAFEVVSQPIAGSFQMLRYTVFSNGRRIGSLASVPSEADCRELAHPPEPPPYIAPQYFFRAK